MMNRIFISSIVILLASASFYFEETLRVQQRKNEVVFVRHEDADKFMRIGADWFKVIKKLINTTWSMKNSKYGPAVKYREIINAEETRIFSLNSLPGMMILSMNLLGMERINALFEVVIIYAIPCAGK